MHNLRIARGYAKALTLAATDANAVSEVREGIRGLRALYEESEPLRAFLAETTMPPATKADVLTQVFGGTLPPLLHSFLILLVEKRRERELGAILEEATRQFDEREGIETAFVTTAVPLTDAQSQSLAERLSGMTGKTIQLRRALDPDLLGGFVVRIRDTTYDASVTAQLRHLRETLTRGNGG